MNLSILIAILNQLIWSKPMIFLCVGAGVFFTLRLRFPQIRHFRLAWRLLLSKDNDNQGVTPFQAFATTIGGHVGVGSIGGVATAICLGGPGSIFWMWLIALIGMSTGFMEATLGQAYKTKLKNEFVGGPQYYIEQGIGCKWYARWYAIVAIISMGILLPGSQSYSVASAMQSALGIPIDLMGIIFCVLLALVIFGGVKRICRTAEVIAPIMSIAFILMALVIVLFNLRQVPATFALIFRSAFGQEQAFAGIAGSAVILGVKRSIFSNEAGDGTSALISAAAVGSHPAKQGLLASLSIFITTIVIGSATALMILLTGAYNVADGAGGYLVEHLPGVEYGIRYTQEAIDRSLGGFGDLFVAISVFFFAFMALTALCYMAESNVNYLFPNSRIAKIIMRVVFLAGTYLGVKNTGAMIWTWGDLGIGMMVWLNVIALLLLFRQGAALLTDFEFQLRQGIDPIFDPALFHIKDEQQIWKP